VSPWTIPRMSPWTIPRMVDSIIIIEVKKLVGI